jgi:hypothetical protein
VNFSILSYSLSFGARILRTGSAPASVHDPDHDGVEIIFINRPEIFVVTGGTAQPGKIDNPAIVAEITTE